MVDVTDIGPTPSSFGPAAGFRSPSGRILSLAVAADARRLYAGSYAGVWRSDDGGRTWRQLTRPQTGSFAADVPGALFAPYVGDLVVSPANPDVVLVAGASPGNNLFTVSRDGIYRTADGGATWTAVLMARQVGQVAFAPDDGSLAMAAAGGRIVRSQDGGVSWSTVLAPSPNQAWHVAIGPLEPSGVRRVYAAGNDAIWYSIDGGVSWRQDPGAGHVQASRAFLSAYRIASALDPANLPPVIPPFGLPMGFQLAMASQALAIEPGNPARVYLAAQDGTLGPTYFAPSVPDGTPCNVRPERGAAEGSLWLGDFTGFESTGLARWEMVPGPPVYWGGSTPSGKVWVSAKPTPGGYLLFFADQSHVHVAAGQPTASSAWHRLDGRNASVARRMNALSNHLFVHVDPHALVTSPDFEITLRVPTDVPAPYDRNSELDQHLAGTVWMANDGGVVWSDDGGQTWHTAEGLPTLDAINLAGLARVADRPALYLGTGDNDSFFSNDGGQVWRSCATALGDADAWFADIARADWVVQFAPVPRGPGIYLWKGAYPNAASSSAVRSIPTPTTMDAANFAHNVSSRFVGLGYRPLIRTLDTEAAPPDGDFLLIGVRGTDRVLLRTRALSEIADPQDWLDPSLVEQVGPALPQAGVTVVQAAGGHQHPEYYVSNSASLWKLDRVTQQWRQIVPGGPVGRQAFVARRFFVDPFNPALIYLLDTDRFRVSLDGGESWVADANLTRAATGNGLLSLATTGNAIRDMLFVRGNRARRFSFGAAGIMMTDDGIDWHCLLNSIAMPGLPETGFYDGIADPVNPALYAILEARGVVRLDLPAALPPEPPGPLLLALAAILHEA